MRIGGTRRLGWKRRSNPRNGPAKAGKRGRELFRPVVASSPRFKRISKSKITIGIRLRGLGVVIIIRAHLRRNTSRWRANDVGDSNAECVRARVRVLSSNPESLFTESVRPFSCSRGRPTTISNGLYDFVTIAVVVVVAAAAAAAATFIRSTAVDVVWWLPRAHGTSRF